MGNAKKVKKARTKSDIWYTVLAIIIGACLLFGLGVAILQPTGLMDYISLHANTAIKSDHYSVNNAQFMYLTYNYYQNIIQNYYSGSSASLSDEQKTSYISMCKSYVSSEWTTILAVCEAARAEGYSLNDEDKQYVEDNMEALSTAAKQYNMSVSSFIAAMYGSKGIKQGDIKSVIELQRLASSYQTKLNDDFSYSEEDYSKYYEDNKNDFLKADYYSYTIKADYASDADDEAKEAARTEAEAKAQELFSRIEGGEDYITVITEYEKSLAQAEKEAAEKALEEAKAAETETETEADTAEAADTETVAESESEAETEPAKTAEETALDNAVAKLEGITEESVKTSVLKEGYKASTSENTKELDEWIFAESPAQNGAVKKIKFDSDDTVVIYQIVKSAYRDEYNTVTIRELGLSATSFKGEDDEVNEDAMKEYAQKITDAYNNGADKSAEAFDKLVDEYSTDEIPVGSSGQLKEVSKNGGTDASDIEIDEWLFSEERKAGDVKSFVVYSDGELQGITIIYFEETGRAKWLYDVDSAMRSKDLETKIDEFTQTYNVTVNEKSIDKVK